MRKVVETTHFMKMPVCKFDDGLVEIEVQKWRLFVKTAEALKSELRAGKYTLRVESSYLGSESIESEDGTRWFRLDCILDNFLNKSACPHCNWGWYAAPIEFVRFCPFCGKGIE